MSFKISSPSLTGSQCLQSAAPLSECLEISPKKAEQQLREIQTITPHVLEQLRRWKTDFEKKENELLEVDNLISRKISDKEKAKNKMITRIRALDVEKVGQEKLLEDAMKDLRKAESQKQDAINKKDDAIFETVLSGLGAAALGVLFFPSLFLTVPVVAAGTDTITEANEEIERCQCKISGIISSLSESKNQISNVIAKKNEIERDIKSLVTKQQVLHEERGKVRRSTLFLHRTVTFFDDLHVAVNGGLQRTHVLHRIVEKSLSKRQYVLLQKNGTRSAANSFAEAWGCVEKKVIAGDEAGYLAWYFNS